MDANQQENMAQTVERIAQANGAGAVVRIKLEDQNEALFTVIPKDHRLESLEGMLPLTRPRRLKKQFSFIALESFTRYVREFRMPGTRVLVDRSGNACCTFDGHHRTSDGPVSAWGDHVASFNMRFSAQFAKWNEQNKKTFSQRDFADFIESQIPDFLSPDGAHMLTVAKTLDAEQNSKCKSALRENDDVVLAFERTTVLKAGQQGDLAIPSQFSIQIPVLEGEPPRQIDVRLRVSVDDERLKLSYEIIRLQQLLDQVVRSIYATIHNETGETPFMVESLR